jgi:ATP-dependent Clp protease protease subunit
MISINDESCKTRGMSIYSLPLSVFEPGQHGERQYDVFSYLAKDGTLWITEEVNDEMMMCIVSQLLIAKKQGSSKIKMLIQSPGGSVASMLTICHVMNTSKTTVETICLSSAASAAAIILMCGTKGHRKIMPHGRVMLHDISGGAVGTFKDVKTQFNEFEKLRNHMRSIILNNTKITESNIEEFLDRDRWIDADEAVELGIVNSIITGRIDG